MPVGPSRASAAGSGHRSWDQNPALPHGRGPRSRRGPGRHPGALSQLSGSPGHDRVEVPPRRLQQAGLPVRLLGRQGGVVPRPGHVRCAEVCGGIAGDLPDHADFTGGEPRASHQYVAVGIAEQRIYCRVFAALATAAPPWPLQRGREHPLPAHFETDPRHRAHPCRAHRGSPMVGAWAMSIESGGARSTPSGSLR